MGSIQVRKETGCLIIDFYYQGIRCREQTALPDTQVNRKKVEKLISKVEEEISLNTFDYRRYFPSSRNAAKFVPTLVNGTAGNTRSTGATQHTANQPATPLFRDFSQTWYEEKLVEWRKTHRLMIRNDLDKLLIPRFGNKEVGQITKAEVLAYRAELAKAPARGKTTPISNARINKIMNPLRQIINESADRFDFRSPYQNIKQLKIRKTDVHPFSIEDVKKIIDTVRADFKNYFTVRFFTGMRTGEIDGLKWKFVDFDHRLIMIRETIVAGDEEYTKNDGSQRDIQMSQLVYDALKEQEKATKDKSAFVFCNRNLTPLAHKNVTKRVWYPLLRYLNIPARRPYQCRHTAATIWLASGENPQWIAMQLGHTTTEMLFRVYSRFVPNLTRKDGSAMERLLISRMGNEGDQTQNANITPDASEQENSHD